MNTATKDLEIDHINILRLTDVMEKITKTDAPDCSDLEAVVYPYTGLKPAGSASPIIVMADQAIANKEVNTLTTKLDDHLNKVLADKYNEVMEKSLTKDNSTAEGREYVRAYVEYTHFLEAIRGIIEGGASHEGH